MYKAVLLVCAQALLFQSISAQCVGAYPAATLAAAPCGAGWGLAGPASALSASNGPGLAIASASPISPVGVSVASENAIEGTLVVAGAVPFLGTVGLEGVLPTAGAGDVSYNCGTGAVAITAEDVAAPLAAAVAVGPVGYSAGPLGYGTGPLGFGAGPVGYGAIGAPFGGCGCGI